MFRDMVDVGSFGRAPAARGQGRVRAARAALDPGSRRWRLPRAGAGCVRDSTRRHHLHLLEVERVFRHP